VTTLRELKGAPISCLLALYLIGRPARKEEIADLSGFAPAAVQSALRCLSRPTYNLVLALPSGRHPLWTLTAHAQQMPLSWAVLTAGEPYVAMSREKSDSPSSSSSSDIESIQLDSLLLLPPLSREKSESPGNPEADRLAAMLTDMGCTRALARAAVAEALEEDSPEIVEAQIILWRHYCASPHGASIHAPGFFVARKIQQGETAPSSARAFLKQLPHPEATGQPWDPARDWPHPDYVRLLELTEASTVRPFDKLTAHGSAST